MSTWMVVEDEPDLYDTLLALFGIWSIDGVAFTNGTDAIKWIESVDAGNTETNIPELAILDIRLPGVEGPDIGARLRKSPLLKNVAIVLITTYHLSPKDEKAVIEKAQADDLVYKPLPAPAKFRQILQKAINTRRSKIAEAEALAQPDTPEQPAQTEPPAQEAQVEPSVPPAPPEQPAQAEPSVPPASPEQPAQTELSEQPELPAQPDAVVQPDPPAKPEPPGEADQT